MSKSLPKPNWRRRWALIRIVLVFAGALIMYITLFGADDRVRETALMGSFGLVGAIVLGYLGFATADDRNWLNAQARSRDAREEGAE